MTNVGLRVGARLEQGSLVVQYEVTNRSHLDAFIEHLGVTRGFYEPFWWTYFREPTTLVAFFGAAPTPAGIRVAVPDRRVAELLQPGARTIRTVRMEVPLTELSFFSKPVTGYEHEERSISRVEMVLSYRMASKKLYRRAIEEGRLYFVHDGEPAELIQAVELDTSVPLLRRSDPAFLRWPFDR